MSSHAELLKRQRLAIRIASLAVPCKHVYFTLSFDNPFAVKFANQGSVFVHADHALPLLELALQPENDWLPNAGDRIEVRNDIGGRHNPKAFLRSRQAKTWHTLAKD